eukprot:598068-Rhodomonas_salina.2
MASFLRLAADLYCNFRLGISQRGVSKNFGGSVELAEIVRVGLATLQPAPPFSPSRSEFLGGWVEMQTKRKHGKRQVHKGCSQECGSPLTRAFLGLISHRSA